MNPALEGQVVLVTGGSSSIGCGVAQALANAGASVAINYHSHGEAAETLAASIEKAGGQAIAIQADVSDEIDIDALFDMLIKRFGTVDIVVANSGLQKDAKFIDMMLADWNAVMNVNLTGQFLTAQRAVRDFLRRGPRPVSRALGKIICMSFGARSHSVGGACQLRVVEKRYPMMKSLAQEVAPHRIRVNSIAPYGRIGESEDIGRAAVWLASDDSDYVGWAQLCSWTAA